MDFFLNLLLTLLNWNIFTDYFPIYSICHPNNETIGHIVYCYSKD